MPALDDTADRAQREPSFLPRGHRQHDERQSVRQHLEEMVRDLHAEQRLALESNLERRRQPEEKTPREARPRIPARQHHQRQRHESASRRHVLDERVRGSDGERHAREPGHEPAEQNGGEAHAARADPGGLHRFRVLAARTHDETRRRSRKEERHGGREQERRVTRARAARRTRGPRSERSRDRGSAPAEAKRRE